MLAFDAKLDVGHQIEALGGDGLLALDAQAEGIVGGVVVALGETSQRGHHAAQHLGAVAVAARRDGLRHLDQGLGVVVDGDGGGIPPGGLDLDVAFGEDLGLQLGQAFPIALARGPIHPPVAA